MSDTYVTIKTTTKPLSITITEAAELSGMKPSTIHVLADRGHLSFGYAFMKNGKAWGQKLIVLDSKWKAFLLTKQKAKKRRK